MRSRNGEARSAPWGPSSTGVPLFSPLRQATGMTSGFSAQAGVGAAAEMRGASLNNVQIQQSDIDRIVNTSRQPDTPAQQSDRAGTGSARKYSSPPRVNVRMQLWVHVASPAGYRCADGDEL